MFKFLLTRNYLHCTASEYKGRSHKDRISYLACSLYSFIYACDRITLRLWYIKFIQKPVKLIPVFCPVYRIASCSYYLNSPVPKRSRQVDGRLSAEGSYDTHRFFKIYYVHHIFNTQRLKIELIRAAVIGRHGLGIIIDDYRFISGLPYRSNSVYR